MNKTKFIDECFATIRLPVLSDRYSMYPQFFGKCSGNDAALRDADQFISAHAAEIPVMVRSVIVDADSGGDTPANITACACEGIGISITSLVVPSFAQIGCLADLFCRELAIRRFIPIVTSRDVHDANVHGIHWERADWPRTFHPVFRFHRPDSCAHNQMWVMLPQKA